MEKFSFDYFLFKREVKKPSDAEVKDNNTIHFKQDSMPTAAEIEEEVRRRRYPHLNWGDYLLLFGRRNS